MRRPLGFPIEIVIVIVILIKIETWMEAPLAPVVSYQCSEFSCFWIPDARFSMLDRDHPIPNSYFLFGAPGAYLCVL